MRFFFFFCAVGVFLCVRYLFAFNFYSVSYAKLPGGVVCPTNTPCSSSSSPTPLGQKVSKSTFNLFISKKLSECRRMNQALVQGEGSKGGRGVKRGQPG